MAIRYGHWRNNNALHMYAMVDLYLQRHARLLTQATETPAICSIYRLEGHVCVSPLVATSTFRPKLVRSNILYQYVLPKLIRGAAGVVLWLTLS